MKIEHFALNIEDPAALAEWYTQHLGMRVARKVDDPRRIHFLVDSAGVGLIEFYNNTNVAIPDYRNMAPDSLHIALSTADMEADIQRLVAAGAKQEGEVIVTPGGDRLAFLRDPWGICLQLAQRAEPIL